MKLRDYQINAINNIRLEFAAGNNRVVLCAPTGAGKTVIFSEITRLTVANGKKVLIITNRKELLLQSNNKLLQFGIEPFILNANTKTVTDKNTSVTVAMVETLHRRLSKPDYIGFIQSFDLIIIDEAHINCFNKLFSNTTDKQRIIGCSATPQRRNPQPALELFYDSIINVCQVGELIEQGFLSKAITYSIPINLKGLKIKGGDYDIDQMSQLYDNEVKYIGAVTNYEIHSKGKKTLVFCASIKNSQTLTAQFNDRDYEARHFDCYMNDNERNDVLTWFYNTSNAILCNVGILTTGFDCPDIECILLYRATKSLPLFLQMCGRGSRITDFKKMFTILDFGNNIKTHGFWEADRDWSLKNPTKKKTGVAPVKECTQCQALIEANAKVCKYCGYEFITKIEPKKEIEVILERLSPSEFNRMVNSGDLTVKELEEIRISKSFKVGWVLHKLKSFNEFLEYEKIKGYKRGWAAYQWAIIRGSNN
jgi:superfamily II DNA or RNA helicase